MAKFKVGDKVLVKNIKADARYYMEDGKAHDAVTFGMLNHSGKVVTIAEITPIGKYRIKEDRGTWNWVDGMFEGLAENPKIVITTDGKTTTARLFNGKELIRKAEAKCSPDDTFDFMVGAKLAMERLEEPVTAPEKKFTPHLELRGEHYGNIGEKTNYKDAIGRELRIGDTVDLYRGTEYIREKAIVFSNGCAFVMGIRASCKDDGTIGCDWQIIKKRGYEDVPNGETVDVIKYIKEA
jgi:hypothetical protein